MHPAAHASNQSLPGEQDNMDSDRDIQVNEGYSGHSLEGEMEVEIARGQIAV